MIISAVTMAEEPEFISFLKRKFKTDGKHKHHDSQVCPERYVIQIRDGRKILEFRTCQKTRKYITEHYRLFHFFEKKSHNGTEKQNPCKIRNESVGVVFFRAWSLRRRVYFSGDFLSQFSDSFLSQRRIFGGYGYIGHFKSYVFG